MASTTSARRPHSTTSAPASASTIENAVPHDPVPSTATRVMPASFAVVGLGGRRGSPVTGTPALRGSYRTPGACSPRISSSSAVMAAMMRSVTSCRSAASTGRSRTSSRSTGGPAQTCIVLRGNRCGRLRVRRQDLLRPPLRHRDHRGAGLQRDPGGTGLADHRPQLGVAGQRGLRVDGDALPRPHRGHRRRERLRRVGRLAVDRDLLGAAQHPPDEEEPEEHLLAEEPRQPPVVVEEVREGQRVDVRDVVGDDHEAAVGRDVLGPAPVAAGQDRQQRPEDDDGEPVPEADRPVARPRVAHPVPLRPATSDGPGRLAEVHILPSAGPGVERGWQDRARGRREPTVVPGAAGQAADRGEDPARAAVRRRPAGARARLRAGHRRGRARLPAGRRRAGRDRRPGGGRGAARGRAPRSPRRAGRRPQPRAGPRRGARRPAPSGDLGRRRRRRPARAAAGRARGGTAHARPGTAAASSGTRRAPGRRCCWPGRPRTCGRCSAPGRRPGTPARAATRSTADALPSLRRDVDTAADLRAAVAARRRPVDDPCAGRGRAPGDRGPDRFGGCRRRCAASTRAPGPGRCCSTTAPSSPTTGRRSTPGAPAAAGRPAGAHRGRRAARHVPHHRHPAATHCSRTRTGPGTLSGARARRRTRSD